MANKTNTLKFTWHSNTRPHIHCRLDYFLISESPVKYAKTNIKPGYKTDHCLVDLTIDNMSMERGPGIFKMNNSILLDNAYQTKVKDSIRETIKYSVFKNKSEREKETKLVNEIKLLEEKLGNCSSNEVDTITKEIIHKKTRIRTL